MITIVSSSLQSVSKSRILAGAALDIARHTGLEARLIDLRDYPLSLCDGEDSFSQPHVETLKRLLGESRGVILASPIYNYDVSATLKNLIEHVGGELTDKVVGLLCAAGGERSYMSVMPFLNSLMLDYRTIVIPRFVFATEGAFDGDSIRDEGVVNRVRELVVSLSRMSTALEVANAKGAQ